MAHLHLQRQKSQKKSYSNGKNPNVYCVGGLGVDNIKTTSLYTKTALQEKLNVKFLKKVVLVTYHPETLKKQSSKYNLNSLFKALETLKNTTVIFTMPNSYQSILIYNLISKFVSTKNYYLFKSLGPKLYYSCCKHSDFMIGNSSSEY